MREWITDDGLEPPPDRIGNFTQSTQKDSGPIKRTVSSAHSVFSVSSAHSVYCDRDTTRTAAIGEKALAIIKRTVPQANDALRHCLFRYVRAMKSLPGASGFTDEDIAPYAHAWYRHIPQSFHANRKDRIEADDIEQEMVELWEYVEVAEGGGKQEVAVERSRDLPYPPETEGMSEPLRKLASICRELQREAHGDPFFLSCRSVASILGVSHTRGGLWLRFLVRRRVLQVVEKGTRAGFRATTYYYLGSMEDRP